MDAHGRRIDTLRISVTDRCDERCLYCMPAGYRGWGSASDELTVEEIARVARVAVGLGFRRFRLTGGEPLTRKDTPDIVRALSAIPGVEGIGLTTNGARLAECAADLRAAGLRMLNVSLDALDAAVYRRMTGGDVTRVVAGIRTAQAAGFERLKLNCVLLRGFNDSALWPLIHFAGELGVPLRLIELMPLSPVKRWNSANFMPVAEMRRAIAQRDELVPLSEEAPGWGPASYYRLRRLGTVVGFIGAVTTSDFCATCNKMRLTADGKIRPCLAAPLEFDVRAILRQPHADAVLREVWRAALQAKPLKHRFDSHYQPCRPMTAIGG